MKQHLVIGDIHGCFREFRDLLDRAALNDGDEIVAVGDLVDRGPDSGAVLEFFRSTPGATAVMGNHERKNVRVYRNEVRPALSQRITRRQLGEARYAQECAFMASLPTALELSDALIVHAFWEPGRCLADQQTQVLVGTMAGERLLQQVCDSRRWYEHYDGPKPLIVGHRDHRQNGEPLIFRDRVFCIDTSCVHGRRLSGLILPAFRVVSVPARQAYWTAARRENADLNEQPA